MKIFLFSFIFSFLVSMQLDFLIAQPATWEKLYGDGIGYRGIETSSKDFVIVSTTTISGRSKIVVNRIDVKGEVIWEKIYGDVNYYYDAYWIDQTFDGGFIIAAHYSGPGGEAYLLKIDSLGTMEWEKNYGGGLSHAYRVYQCSDKGYIIGARGHSSPPPTIFQLRVIKTDSTGNVQWHKSFGNSIHFGDLIKITNGYLLMGSSSGAIIYRLNNNGDSLWSKKVNDNIGVSVRQTNEGGYIFGCRTPSPNPYQTVVAKTDSLGNIQWERLYQNEGSEVINNLEVLPNDRGYLISGTTDFVNNDTFKALARIIDTDGDVKHLKYYSPAFYPNKLTEFRSGIPTSDGGLFFCGFIYPYFPGIIFAVKTDSNGYVKPVGIKSNDSQVDHFHLDQNYPNPFNPSTTITFKLSKAAFIELKLYDANGKYIQTITSGRYSEGIHQNAFSANGLASGIYYYILKSNKNIVSKKMMYLK